MCCCLSVLEHWGHFEDVTTAREDYEAGRDGLSVAELKSFLVSRHMEVRVFRARSILALQKFEVPVILYWENYHFVVLESYDGRRAMIMDPAVGRRRLETTELEAAFSGVVLAALPAQGFQRVARPKALVWRQTPIAWRTVAPTMTRVALLSLLSYGFTLVVPALTASLIDRSAQHLTVGWVVATAFTGMVLGFWLINLLRAFVVARLVRVIGGTLMETIFAHLLRLPMRFFATRSPGELMYRLGTVSYLRDALSAQLVQGVLDVGMVCVMVVYISSVSVVLGAVAGAMFLLILGFMFVFKPRLTEAIDAEINHLTRSSAVQQDAVSSIAVIKMGGYIEHFEARWRAEYDASLKALTRRMRVQAGWMGSVVATLQMFSPLVLIVVGLLLAQQGVITLGQAVAVQSLGAVLFGLSTSVFSAYSELLQCTRYLDRLGDVVTTPIEVSSGTRTTIGTASVQVRGLNFAYSRHGSPVLHDVELEIGEGETVSIVGPSGSGKSTLAKVLCALYRPDAGEVRLGGALLQEYDLDRLRPQIGYVPQDVTLHNGTVVENLSLGNDLKPEDIMERCRAFGFLGFLDDLPMGYRTMVSDLGANFSGGQRQRIAIARTLLGRPRIMVLDEATSALDSISESQVMGVIDAMGATKIILAHRLATVAAADRICVMDYGTVVEVGNHEQLIGKAGLYAELYARSTSHV